MEHTFTPAFQRILDQVDEEVALAKRRWEAAHRRGDDRLIELTQNRWDALRRGRSDIYKSLLALQTYIDEAANHPGLTDEELERLFDSET